MILLIIIF